MCIYRVGLDGGCGNGNVVVVVKMGMECGVAGWSAVGGSRA